MAKPKAIDERIWNDEKFHTLRPTEKLLALYSLTSQVNRIGLFKFSVSLAAEDIGLDREVVLDAVRGLCRGLGWRYDEEQRVLYIPTWWKYNPPSTENTLKGMLDDLHALPECPLVDLFCKNFTYLREPLHEKFREECTRHRPDVYRRREAPAEEAHEPSKAPNASPPAEPRVQIAIPIDLKPIDPSASARERVICSWGLRGPEWLHFR